MNASGGEALEGFDEALLDDDANRLYDHAPCGYLSTLPDGTIVKVNQTFLVMTGHQRHELVGRRRFADLLSAGGRIYHETHYAPMLRMQGTAREIAFELVCTDGSRVPVLVNAVLESDDNQTPVLVRIAVFDATERREYERELVRARERAEASEAHAKALAHTLQQTLIPPTPPAIPQLQVAAVYRPAGDGAEVGGDFYDVFQIDTRTWVVVIGDVRGKGVGAAVVTSLARHTLRAASVHLERPSDTLATLNQVLLRDSTERFCTVALVRLTRSAGAWHAAVGSAGHPLPVLRRDGRTPTEIGQPGTVLGVIDEPELSDVELDLQPGDCLLLYTDGVPDGRRGQDFYGEDRLMQVVASPVASAEQLTEAVLEDVLAYQSGDARDDIAIVVVRVPLHSDHRVHSEH